MTNRLSKTDVERLLADPSAESRRETAVKIAAQYATAALSPEERRLAEDILGLMARDVEVKVRAALADNLKDFPGLARDIAVTMAKDVEAVSLPVIRYSAALSDDDLIEIVRTQGTAKQTAVAQRPSVSASVADALADTGKHDVVSALIANDGAAIADGTYAKMLDRFGGDERVTGPMAKRACLPVGIAERLVNLVSERLQDQLVASHALSADAAAEVMIQSRERATLGLLAPDSPAADVQTLVVGLHAENRLTPSIILRALCMGDMAFFEASIAVRAGIPTGSTRALIHDAGSLGLPAVLERAGMPRELFAVFRAAVEVARETEYDGGERDRERFRRRMIERVLTYLDDPSADMGPENAEYLLARLSALDAELLRSHPAG
jgi:uncharacterized protein (DUF2336 family)